MLELGFGDQQASSKVGIASVTGKFSWTDGDKVAVWYQNGTTGSWTEAPISASSITVPMGNRQKLAVYPYGAQTDFNLVQSDDADHPVTKIRYAEEIDLTGKDKDYAPVPMIALNDPTRNGLMFYHVGGLIRFRLHGIPANTKYIRITSDAAPLCGDFPVAIPTGNEINAAELVYTKGRFCTIYDDTSWESIFAPSHGQSVLVKITDSPLAAETDNITINLPVPMGAYNQLTVTALDANKNDLCSGDYDSARKTVTWDCERAKATHLSNLALRPDHPMTNPKYVPGKFSVSPTKEVWFASGNLVVTYKSDGNHLWEFEKNQWGYKWGNNYENYGRINDYGSQRSYDEVDRTPISHFGWGTGNAPYEISASATYDWSDWGVHFNDAGEGLNSRINGTWYTLTFDEWHYLLALRPKASDRIGHCKIYIESEGRIVSGLLILPNNWEKPSGCRVRSGIDTFFSDNYYTTGDSDDYDGYWSDMEAAGAVFLPAAGYRNDTGGDISVCWFWEQVEGYGYYWSSSAYNSNGAYRLYFGSGDVPFLENVINRSWGCSVRLVHD